MAISTNTIQCPACGASLSVQEGKEKTFCIYCGTPIQLTNENEYIVHHIHTDETKTKQAEAKLKQAEADTKQTEIEAALEMRKLELKVEAEKRKRKGRLIAYGVALAFAVVGALICIGTWVGMFPILIGGWIALLTYISGTTNNHKEEEEDEEENSDEVAISEMMVDCTGENYNAVTALFKAAGFSNVNAIPLHDLSKLRQSKNGQVESVTIDGDEEFEEEDTFPKNAVVIIMYHSMQ